MSKPKKPPTRTKAAGARAERPAQPAAKKGEEVPAKKDETAPSPAARVLALGSARTPSGRVAGSTGHGYFARPASPAKARPAIVRDAAPARPSRPHRPLPSRPPSVAVQAPSAVAETALLVRLASTATAPPAATGTAGDPPPASPAPDRAPGDARIRPTPSGDALAAAGGRPTLLVGDGDRAGPGQQRRSAFFDALKTELDAMVDAATRGTAFAGRPCPWVEFWVAHFRASSDDRVARAAALYVRPNATPADAEGLRAAIVARAGDSLRAWLDSGAEPRLPPEAGERGPAGRSMDNVRRWASGPDPAPDPAAVRALARLGPGRPLGAAVGRLASAVGASPAAVRVHDGAAAAAVAGGMGASAFAVGGHVGFAPGRYRPGTAEGDALLAHELAHTAQPDGLSARAAEHDANHAAAAALGLETGEARAMGGGPGTRLRLRGCDPDILVGPPQYVLGMTLARELDAGESAPTMLAQMRGADAAVLPAAMDLLRLKAHAEHVTYYRWLLQRLETGLPAADWAEARRLAGADPVAGTDAIPLSAGATTLLDFLRSPVSAAATSMAPGPSLATTILGELARAPQAELPLVLTALHRTPDAEYGNGLFRLAATIQRTGTAQQYLAFVRLLHQPGMEVALDEADPRLGVQAEREAALNRAGQPSALTDDQMAGLFSARALELAHTLLRDSERQLLRVLTQSQGESAATGPDLDADAGRAIEVLNRLFNPDLPAFLAYETWAGGVRQAAAAQGATVSEAQLRRTYNRQRQILLYRAGAVRLRLLRTSLRQVREEISEHEDWFRTMSNRPVEYNLIGGYAPALMYRQQESERRNGLLRGLRPREQSMAAGQREVEGALPLLGGLDDAGLQRIAELQGGEAEFDQLLAATLNTIFANIVQARRLLQSGEVSVYLLDPVVAATRNALGIGEPPANDTQRRWAAVIARQRAQAVEHRDQVRHVLEIINTGALIAALGLAVFTGGGSLALYAGLAVGGIGLAGGLAASAYDVADARRRTREAETLYGSGLTAETRISDVPADYRFLHFAWIGLGVNVVLSAFMLRGLGTQFAAALRGSEDAVRAQARILVSRLRAAGATQSEEELLESTMAALRERGWVAGAVRGGSVYEVHPTRTEWLTGTGRSLEREVDALATQPRLGGATLARTTPGTGRGAPSVYRMQAPGPGGTPVTADITFEARPAAALPAGAHGTESGPARLVLTPNGSGGWTANVYVHQGLRPGAFPFVMGHELDEISAIIRRLPATATADEIAAQMRPGLFRPGTLSPVLTAHDEAAIAELRSLLIEAAHPRLATGPVSVLRQQRLEALYQSMGLRDPTNIFARTAALDSRLPTGLLDLGQVERQAVSAGVLERFRATPPLSGAAALSRNGSLIIDEGVVEHLIYAEPSPSLSAFESQGVGGGHLDSQLRALQRTNPNYAFLEDAAVSPKAAAGTRFHRYRQYQWDPAAGGGPNAPTTADLRPGGVRFNPAHWRLSRQTKTTVDNIQTLLIEAEDAYTRWRTANPALATGESWGRGVTLSGGTGGQPAAISANGVEFGGYVTYTPATSTTPATWRWRTAFVEASWF